MTLPARRKRGTVDGMLEAPPAKRSQNVIGGQFGGAYESMTNGVEEYDPAKISAKAYMKKLQEHLKPHGDMHTIAVLGAIASTGQTMDLRTKANKALEAAIRAQTAKTSAAATPPTEATAKETAKPIQEKDVQAAAPTATPEQAETSEKKEEPKSVEERLEALAKGLTGLNDGISAKFGDIGKQMEANLAQNVVSQRATMEGMLAIVNPALQSVNNVMQGTTDLQRKTAGLMETMAAPKVLPSAVGKAVLMTQPAAVQAQAGAAATPQMGLSIYSQAF